MVRSTFFLILFLLFTVGFAQEQVAKNEHDAFIKKIYDHTLTSGQTHLMLKELCAMYPHRLSGSAGAEGSVQWAKKQMEDFGFDRVYLQEVMVPHWERGEKEQAVIMLENGETIDLSVLALGRSTATPAEGITAQVVIANRHEDLAALGREKLEGKIVFLEEHFPQQHIRTGRGYGVAVRKRSSGASEAAKYGALAVVIRSVTTAMDDVPHTGALRYAKDDSVQIPAGALGYQSADKLKQAVQDNPKTKLFLRINAQTHPDKMSHNVIGEIRGSVYPDSIIMVSGHLDGWDVGDGAHDDAAGCTHALSAIRTLQLLDYKPRYTLRVVMYMNEENGLKGAYAYADSAVAKGEKHVLAMESDAGGFTPRGFGFSGKESSLEKLRGWLDYFPQYTIDFILDGGGGADVNRLRDADGTPTMGYVPDSQRYFDFHHSPADVFEAVNRRELELGTASMATMVYLIDQMGL